MQTAPPINKIQSDDEFFILWTFKQIMIQMKKVPVNDHGRGRQWQPMSLSQCHSAPPP